MMFVTGDEIAITELPNGLVRFSAYGKFFTADITMTYGELEALRDEISGVVRRRKGRDRRRNRG